MDIIRDDKHQWGEIYENMTGVGVLGSLVEDRADLGISMFLLQRIRKMYGLDRAHI